MDLRHPVKNVLRMCGHAVVSTVHERLNWIQQALQDLLDQNTDLANTQTALLRSGVHQVENLARIRAEIQESDNRICERLRDQFPSKSDIEAVAAALVEIRQASAAEFQRISDAVSAAQAALLQSSAHLGAGLARTGADIKEIWASVAAREDIHGLQRQMEILQRRLDAGVQTGVERMLAVGDDIRNAAASSLASLENESARQASAVLGQMEILQRRLDALTAIVQGLNDGVEKVRQTEATAVQAGVERMLAVGDDIRNTTASSLALLEPVARETRAFLENESVRQVSVETSDYLCANPEVSLLVFLYSYLPSRKALDIGAHTGDVSEHLLKNGYEVYAFEPYPESHRRLRERLALSPSFHAFPFAIGSADGESPLYLVDDHSPDNRYEDTTVFNSLARHAMPGDLSFNGASVTVPVRTLSDLHKQGIVPADVAVVKIDTEGFDLEVIRGMGGHRYPVVMVEYWDTGIPFGTNSLLYTLDSMVEEMRARDYLWYIVVYRVWGHYHTAFFCNHDRAVPGSWGNILFFRDREVFMEAQKWCSATLPRTYFKHVGAVLREAAGEHASQDAR